MESSSQRDTETKARAGCCDLILTPSRSNVYRCSGVISVLAAAGSAAGGGQHARGTEPGTAGRAELPRGKDGILIYMDIRE
eukprot:COSAG06_NODE_7735_length_2395_cov_5.219077_2_plen_81_part_00